ncbi:glutamine synthetase family protein [Meiothermus rufus]|uniref:glutamine synthetase family protein n=1 Tax=Meiothermus rufus TaxID=604332 RepID=UPI0004896A20|nr:glutamine synthetase family protein [Meiothermus rufus]
MREDAATKLNWLAQQVSQGEIETVLVGFPDHYGRLMGKRFEAEYFVEQVAQQGTHGCDYLLTTDMEMEPVQGYRFANWELGYGDFHLVPDLATLRPATWLEKSAVVLCDLEDERTHRPVEVAPRTLLQRQLERARALGYTVMAASELEYYLYRQSYREAFEQGYAGLKPVGHYLEDYHLLQGTREEPFTAAVRRHLKASGIPVENSKGEWGLGQHEVNLRYAEALEMADRHVLFKQCLKEIADAMGLAVTFMAKPHHGQAGSSCHIHLSLWKDGQNAFVGEESYGPVQASRVFGQFLAGWIAYLPDLMPFYAPTVNAYKRYEDGSWAPTRLAWSYDNRTAGFRVVGRGASLRIECRIGGADLNPYLALAAALASGLAGLEQNLTPPPIFQGDIYQARHLPRVPYTLGEAAEEFARSTFAKEALGQAAHEHYTHFFYSEWQAFNRAVTDWERKRYFERI